MQVYQGAKERQPTAEEIEAKEIAWRIKACTRIEVDLFYHHDGS